jgi:hypothetical protein
MIMRGEVMNKTFPLISAILKSFVRNKTSIFLLVVSPLLLIGVIFMSFNADGLQKIPVGIISTSTEFNINDLENSYFSYLKMTRFDNLDLCMLELKKYNQYACIKVTESNTITLDLYYDNTQEPVIWEIIERIKSTVDLIQKQKSEELASDFLGKFHVTSGKVSTFQEGLSEVGQDIGHYIIDIDNEAKYIASARTDFISQLDLMASDIEDAKLAKSDLKEAKDRYYEQSISALNFLDDSMWDANSNVSPQLVQSSNNLRSQINGYNSVSESRFSTLDYKISSYEAAESRSRGYVYNMGQGLLQLETTKDQLRQYQTSIQKTNVEIQRIKDELTGLESVSADNLVNPVVIKGNPTYIPDVQVDAILSGNQSEQAKTLIKGVNMISLQTIFPTILFLIMLFLSLLISTFICLGEINSSSAVRRGLMKHIVIPELLSVFISSMIVVVIPVFFVLMTGDLLFRIHIIENVLPVMAIVTIICSIFVLLGMAIAYLVRKESIALLVTTFILVMLIFLSGFILPIERMSPFSYAFSSIFPSHVGLSAFNRLVFYGQNFQTIQYFPLLMAWLAGLIILVLLSRKISGIYQN